MRERTILLSGEGLDILKLGKGLKKLISPEVRVEVLNDVVVVTLPNQEAYCVFTASFPALKADYSSDLKGLLLPNSDFVFYSSFLEYVKEGEMESIYDLLRKYPAIIDGLKCVVEPFDQEMLYTIKAYIESDCSPLLSSYALFVHRNTITYRIKSFTMKTGIQLDSFTNIMLVYELVLSVLGNINDSMEENIL